MRIAEDGLSAVIKPFRENAKKAARDNKAAQQLLGYLRPKEKEETESSEPQTEEHGALHSWHRNYSFTKEPYEKVSTISHIRAPLVRISLLQRSIPALLNHQLLPV